MNTIIKEYEDLLLTKLSINTKKELFMQLLLKLDSLQNLNKIDKIKRKDTILLIQYALKILDNCI